MYTVKSILPDKPPKHSLFLTMSPPQALPNPPKPLSLLPSSPLSLTLLSPFRTLAFPRKPQTLPPHSLSSSTTAATSHFSEDDDHHVLGDCLVFEDGAFEDPYLQQTLNPKTNSNNGRPNLSRSEVKPEELVPEKWKKAQAEVNITKKERRKIAQGLEFGRRVERNRKGLVPIGEAVEEYVTYREAKLRQLKPLVLDNPSFGAVVEEGGGGGGGRGEGEGEGEGRGLGSGRVAPRNPRMAVYKGSLEDVSEFFRSGEYEASAEKKTEGGRRKLFTKEEKVLLNKRIPDLAAATSGKWQPLHTLVASGEFYLVNDLLKHNVDINIQDKDGLTAMHRAILGKKQAIFNYLLRESANPFVRDKEGATLMHYAVRTAATQMIKILLLYNVDLNLQDNDGWTPLHLAVQTRRTDLVRLLLIKGADKTIKNKDGLTPLDLCLYSGQDTRTYELIKLIKQLPKP